MLAKTPPMGFNTWNTFGPNINEQIILETADAMVDKGLALAGYEYLVIDDGWMMPERKGGRLIVDETKFPHGMKFIGDYIHKKGLKFGIYTAAGTCTCQGLPGSYGHEYDDVDMFAEWGVDYIKYDLCHFPGSADIKNTYLRMSQAMRSCGREMMFSACTVGEGDPHRWVRSVGAHLYRSTGDINDDFSSFRANAISQLRKLDSSAPGCFNDIDMLVVGMNGNGHVAYTKGCTTEEYLLHFSLWCMFSAPLMIGCDVRNIKNEDLAILLNRSLIAIDQDEDARPPYYEERQRYAADGRLAFMKLLSDGDMMIGYYNFADDQTLWVPFYFDDYGIPSSSGYGLELTDVITGENIGVKHDHYNPMIAPRSFKLYRARIVREK